MDNALTREVTSSSVLVWPKTTHLTWQYTRVSHERAFANIQNQHRTWSTPTTNTRSKTKKNKINQYKKIYVCCVGPGSSLPTLRNANTHTPKPTSRRVPKLNYSRLFVLTSAPVGGVELCFFSSQQNCECVMGCSTVHQLECSNEIRQAFFCASVFRGYFIQIRVHFICAPAPFVNSGYKYLHTQSTADSFAYCQNLNKI